LVPVVVLWAVLASAAAACALDLFTLWRHDDATLNVHVGDRVDYRSLTIDQGRRQSEVVRLQCVGEDAVAWVLELLPLVDDDSGLHPIPGEGWRLRLSRSAGENRGRFEDHVLGVEQWLDGEPRSVPMEEWRSDPLLQTILSSEFTPESCQDLGQTTRVVSGRDLLCDRVMLADRDTSLIELPRGNLLQVHVREVSASFHADIPFLGVAHAAERSETSSEIQPAGSRRAPPPRIRIETMELVDFGRDAKPWLGQG